MSPARPHISVCTPAYQAERWLPEMLSSVWAQDIEDLEVVVVDDGSTDGTSAVLASQDDPRLRVVRHTRNRGQVQALSHALALSRGRLVKFVDADDVLVPGALRRLADALEAEPRVGLAFGRRRLILEEPDDEYSRRWAQEFVELHGRFSALAAVNSGPRLLDEYLAAWGEGGNWLSEPSGVMVRRACLERTGGAHLRMVQSLDMDLWARILAFADAAFVDDVVFHYRVTAGGVTALSVSDARSWLDPLWSLEGLASFPEILARHPQVAHLLRLRQRRAVSTLARAVLDGAPRTGQMGRELADYVRVHAARRAGRRVPLYGPVPPV